MIDNRDDISNETKVIFKEKNKKLIISFIEEAKQIISDFCTKTKEIDTKHQQRLQTLKQFRQHPGKCHRWIIGNTFKYCNRPTCRILKTKGGTRFTNEKIYRFNKLSKVQLLAKHGLFSTDIEKMKIELKA